MYCFEEQEKISIQFNLKVSKIKEGRSHWPYFKHNEYFQEQKTFNLLLWDNRCRSSKKFNNYYLQEQAMEHAKEYFLLNSCIVLLMFIVTLTNNSLEVKLVWQISYPCKKSGLIVKQKWLNPTHANWSCSRSEHAKIKKLFTSRSLYITFYNEKNLLNNPT